MKFPKNKIAKLKNGHEGGGEGASQADAQEERMTSDMEDRPWKRASKRVRKICFKCRKRGHLLQDCRENDGRPVCFRCGSRDHTLRDCTATNEDLPFATCFVCENPGHLAFQCPQNRKGIYPRGRGCFFCGSVMHKKADCPHFREKGSKPQDPYQV